MAEKQKRQMNNKVNVFFMIIGVKTIG